MSRRQRELLIIGALLTAGLLGCGRSSETTLRFWNGFTGPDGRTMLRIVKRFNRENPDAHVLMQRMDWATYYNKLFVAGIGNRSPEVFIIHTDVLERFIQAGFLRSVDDLMQGPDGLDAADLDANVWQAVRSGDGHYALPLDVHPLGVYYNKELFTQAGIVDEQGNPKPPSNREEFMTALERMTRDLDGDGRTDQWGFVFTWQRTNVFTFMNQWEGRFFTEDYSQCLLNSPENVQALQFCVDLIQKHKFAPSPENFDSWIGFRQGKVAMVLEGIYMLADVQKQLDLDYAGAPVPQVGSVKAAWASSHNICIRADLTGERLDAAWRFARFLSDNSLDWAQGGQVPVRKSLRDSDRFRAMPIQWEFAKQIQDIRYMPKLPFVFEFYTEFDAAIEKALRGTLPPQHALDTATKNINEIIARHNALQAQLKESQHE